MSTKIFNAYKFDGTIQDLMLFLRETREKYKVFLLNHLKSKFNAESTLEDFKTLEKVIKESMKSPYRDVFSFECSCVVYFEDGIHVQFFNMDRKGFQYLDDRFTDYHYQNQTDPWYDYENYDRKKAGKPEFTKTEYAAHKKDWKERKKFWNKIFDKGIDTPAVAGLTFEFFNSETNNLGMLLFDLSVWFNYFRKKNELLNLKEGTPEFEEFLGFAFGQTKTEWVSNAWIGNPVSAKKVYEDIGLEGLKKLLKDGKINKAKKK